MKEKVPLVFWSGRAEATAYVLDCIKSGRTIDTISMVHPEKAHVAKAEHEARQKLDAYLIETYPSSIRNQYICSEGDIISEFPDESPHNCIYWGYYLLLNFNPQIHSHVVCCMAKNGTSPYWQFHRDMMMLFEHMRTKYHRDDITMQFPYKMVDREILIESLDKPMRDMICTID